MFAHACTYKQGEMIRTCKGVYFVYISFILSCLVMYRVLDQQLLTTEDNLNLGVKHDILFN